VAAAVAAAAAAAAAAVAAAAVAVEEVAAAPMFMPMVNLARVARRFLRHPTPGSSPAQLAIRHHATILFLSNEKSSGSRPQV
jgi:curli biogenesis system outer membrane secretion channel CsgG